MAESKYTRRDLPIDGLHLNISEVHPAPPNRVMFVGEADCHTGDPIATVHVISKWAGGQIRGYVLHKGVLKLWLPAYPWEHPLVDQAVSDVMGLPIIVHDATSEVPSR